MSEDVQTSSDQLHCEGICLREEGPFRSRSHLINHVNYFFGIGQTSQDETDVAKRFALIRTETERPWKYFDCFDDESKRIRARDHVLSLSWDMDEWSQILITCKRDENNETVWDYSTPTSLDLKSQTIIVREAIELWADLFEKDIDEFLGSSSCFILMVDWPCLVLDRISVKSFGRNDIPFKINDRRVLEKKYCNSIPWRAFAIHICQNENIKKSLFERQNGTCAICNKQLAIENSVVHHVDYDHECPWAKNGSDWKLPKARVRPDCGRCETNHPEWHEQCLSRLRLVHLPCNRKVE